LVPTRSAQTAEAASTMFVPAKHGQVHHTVQSTTEIKRILCEHLESPRR